MAAPGPLAAYRPGPQKPGAVTRMTRLCARAVRLPALPDSGGRAPAAGGDRQVSALAPLCRAQLSRNETTSDSGARGMGGWGSCGSA
jgi:hypothetical protein